MVGIGTWTDNFVKNRARIVQDEILSDLLKHCNDNNIAIATGVDAQIDQAYAVGVAHTANIDTDELPA